MMNDPVIQEKLVTRMMTLQILCVALIIFLVGVLVLFTIFVLSNKRHQKGMRELVRYTTNVQAAIDDSVKGLLDSIITDAFTDYMIKELEPRQELFITAEREIEIRTKLVDYVVDRLSPMALDKIGLFYNVHKIDTIIADKVYIIVMKYVIDHNELIRDKDASEASEQQIVTAPAASSAADPNQPFWT